MKAVPMLCLVLLAQGAFAQQHDHLAASASPAAEQQQHEHGADEAVADAHAGHTAQAVDHSAHQMMEDHAEHQPAFVRDDSPAMQQARHMLGMMHGDSINYLLFAERFERHEDDALVWEAQGWVGGDIRRFWFKSEGHYDTDASSTEEAEVQLLYGQALAPFWDLQAGLRHSGGEGASRTHAVLGLQGLAPYWFELDLAAFLSERGDLSTRLEAEYELRLSQRLLLQPRLELNYHFDDDLAAGIGKGMGESSFGLRLRYEWRREFAPYLGLEWRDSHGNTAKLLRAAGRESGDAMVVAGLRLWW